MSMFFKNLDEDCVGPEIALRDLPTDRIIKKLNSMGGHIEKLVLPKEEYDELVNQVGSKFKEPFLIYTAYGVTKIEK